MNTRMVLRGSRAQAQAIGMDTLSDAQLVGLLLGTGPPGEGADAAAAALLEEHGGLVGLARAGVGGLADSPGVGAARATRLAAALELGRRVQHETPPQRMRDPADVWRWARSRLAQLEHEELWVIALDGGSRLRAARRVAMGGLHGLHVATRDPLRYALREGASAFVLVHNHPSGDPTPSPEDIVFTSRVMEGSEVVGTPLVDHVVVTRTSYCSMADKGLILAPSSVRRGGSGGSSRTGSRDSA